MKVSKYLFICIFFYLGLTLHSIAQDEEKALTKIIEDMVNQVGNIQSSDDVNNFLEFHSPNYTAIQSGLMIGGTSGVKNVTLADLEYRIKRVLTNDEYQIVPKLEEINYMKILKNTAFVNSTITYSVNDNGELLFSGSQNRTQTFIKTKEGWKILREYIAEVRDNLQKYDCTFEVYGKNDNSTILKVYYPAGDAFQSEYIDVEIEELAPENLRISTDKGDQFQWTNQTLIPATARTTTSDTINVKTRTGVYAELVKYYFSDRCISAKRSK